MDDEALNVGGWNFGRKRRRLSTNIITNMRVRQNIEVMFG
jgi:hypothetical protein